MTRAWRWRIGETQAGTLFVLIAVLLVGLALRTAALGRHPLWWDEGISAYFSHHDLLTIISETRATDDADPPVYRLTLGVWTALIGSSPFALRVFSAFLGIAAIPLIWAIGCWLTGRKAALLAATLVAVAPFQVHYGREAKCYTFVTALALLSTYAWGRRLGYSRPAGSPSKRAAYWWLAYILSTTAALGAHYYLALLILWQGAWVIGSLVLGVARGQLTRARALSRLGTWLLAITAVAAIVTPWVVLVFGTTARGVGGLSGEDGLPIWTYLGQVGSAFAEGSGNINSLALLAGIGITILTVIGAATSTERLFLPSWLYVPLMAAYLMQSSFSFFSARFLLYLGPPCYLLVSNGIITMRRRTSIIIAGGITIALICLWAPVLRNETIGPHLRPYVGPIRGDEDAQPTFARLRSQAKPGDALVYGYLWQIGYLFSYFPGQELATFRAYYSPDTVGPELKNIFSSHERLWLLSYRISAEDRHNLPASWLEAEAAKVESNWYGRHHLALYLSPEYHTEGVGPKREVATFDNQIELDYPVVSTTLWPGDTLLLALRWRALSAPGEDYQVFAHLGPSGIPPLVQADGPPRNGLSPTGTWEQGQEVWDRRALVLPDSLPAGQYPVRVGLYRLSDAHRLPVDGQPGLDSIHVGAVSVQVGNQY